MPFSRSSGGQGAQIVHGAEARVDLAVVADGIAAVVVAVGRLEERHEMEVGQPQFLEIGNLGAHPLQVAGEEIDVADAAQHLLGLKPAWILLARARRVPCSDAGRSSQDWAASADDTLEMIEKVIAVAVQVEQAHEEIVEVLLQPAPKGCPRLAVDDCGEFHLQPRQQAMQSALCFAECVYGVMHFGLGSGLV